MKLTKQQLQQIIREELKHVLLKENLDAAIESWRQDPDLANKRKDHIDMTIDIRLAHKDDDAPDTEEKFLWQILGNVESRESWRPDQTDEDLYDDAYELQQESAAGYDEDGYSNW